MALSGTWSIEWASSTWGGYPKGYRWKGSFARSGNTITLSNMTLQIYLISGTSGWGTATDSVTVTGGSAQTVNWGFSGTESNIVSLNNTSFSVGSTATSATINCAIAGENTGSTTIRFDASGSAPTGLTATNITPLVDGFSADVSITGWGGLGNANSRFKSFCVRTYDASSLISPRICCSEYGDDLSTKITTTNASATLIEGVMEVIGNTRYTLSCVASNGTYSTSHVRIGDYATLAYKPSVRISWSSSNAITFEYELQADGGFYDKTVEYSLDGGATWTTITTVTGGSATSGSFAVPIEDLQRTSKMLVSATTTAGRSYITHYLGNVKLYGSVNGQTTTVTKLYGPVGGQARSIVKLYGSVNGKAKRIY